MKYLITGAVLASAVAGTLYWGEFDNSQPPIPANTSIKEFATSENNKVERLSSSSLLAEQVNNPDGNPIALFVQKLAAELLDKYGETIQNKQTQARLLEEHDYVMELYPDNGESIFSKVIYTAFPEYAAEILNILSLLIQYQRWLEENHLALSEMTLLERKGAIWDKRRQLFGSDAEEIWAEERFAWAEREQKVQQIIESLDKSYENSLNETLFQFQEALDAVYDKSIEQLALENGVIANVYFGFESVQEQLRKMPPDLRQQNINELRKQLGYTDEQVQQLAQRDNKRNRRWENGLNYMAQRNELTARLSGAELERELDMLREKYFKHEAKTIALEERDGFFRYERPRLYGRN